MSLAQVTALPVFDHSGGAGPTLVFLHYWGGSARTWRQVAAHLPGRDKVTIDFRGWGRSRDLAGPYTLRQLADDTLAIIASSGISAYVLVGHSMGGKVAQLVAATRPSGLRGIVLVGSGPAKPAVEITEDHRLALSHAYDTAESVVGARDNVLTATPLPDGIAHQVLEDSRSSADAARVEWPLRGIAEDITDQTRRIQVPTLVIAGERDAVEPIHVLRENLVPYLSDARFHIIARSGHLMPLEAPVELAAAIDDFTTDI